MDNKIKISAKHLNVFYGQKQALFDITLEINQNEVTALNRAFWLWKIYFYQMH